MPVALTAPGRERLMSDRLSGFPRTWNQSPSPWVSPSKRNMHWRDRSFDKKQRVLPLPDLGSFITGVIFIADGLTNNAVNAILPQ